MVKKKNVKWRMHTYFNFLLSKIDKMIDSAAGS
jgi:hypothetical protein